MPARPAGVNHVTVRGREGCDTRLCAGCLYVDQQQPRPKANKERRIASGEHLALGPGDVDLGNVHGVHVEEERVERAQRRRDLLAEAAVVREVRVVRRDDSAVVTA
eukprot:7171036-Prymnesium_polylepis.1